MSHFPSIRALCVVLIGVHSAPAPANAQLRGSEQSTLTQVVNGTTISIDYARPHVRGRQMFGGQIDWGHVWTPGANWATTIEFSRDVTFAGVPTPAGAYSMWVVPAENGPWDVILDSETELYHTQPPARSDDQIVASITPREVPHRESLIFDFVLVQPDGTDLELRFETVALDFRVDIEAEPIPQLTEAEAAPYVGTYTIAPPPGQELPPDMPQIATLTLSWEDGRLLLRSQSPAGPVEDMLIPAADHVFQLGLLLDGTLMEVEQDMYFEFDVQAGRAIGLEVRGLEDRLMVSATRSN